MTDDLKRAILHAIAQAKTTSHAWDAVNALLSASIADTAGAKLLINEDYAQLCSSDWLKAVSDSAPATPAPSVADAAGREKELVEIIRRSHSSAASDNAAGASDKPLTDAQIEAGWRQTFSTDNPYCPCNLKSFAKAVRWAERAKETVND